MKNPPQTLNLPDVRLLMVATLAQAPLVPADDRVTKRHGRSADQPTPRGTIARTRRETPTPLA